MIDLDRRFRRIEREVLTPQTDPLASLADDIKAARQAARGRPPMSPEEAAERGREMRARFRGIGRY